MPAPNSALTLAVLTPVQTQVEGLDVLGKLQGVHCAQGQRVAVQLILHTDAGDPILLDGAVPEPSSSIIVTTSSEAGQEVTPFHVKARVMEALSFGVYGAVQEVPGEIIDPKAATVRFPIPDGMTDLPAILLAQVALCDANENVVHVNEVLIAVNPGLFGKYNTANGFPGLDKIRLRLRDSAAEDNFLLTHVEFDDAEICDAVVQTIEYFNEAEPIMIGYRFNTSTFPYPLRIMDGIAGKLLELAANHYRREEVEYSAAGVTFNDKAKEKQYLAESQRRWQAWAAWTRHLKAKVNFFKGFKSFGSNIPQWGGRW
jgi:hypothetical protein